MSSPIYLDHHAAAPLSEVARAAMDEVREQTWANPSSSHRLGRFSRRLREEARRKVAASIGAPPKDIVFTSGGTEACNLMVLGLVPKTGAFESLIALPFAHPAVARSAEEEKVREVFWLPGCPRDFVSVAALKKTLSEAPSPAALVLPWVDHETGSVVPLEEIGELARDAGAFLFIDATQAYGRVPIDVEALECDALVLASHKVGGPAGAGALWFRSERLELEGRTFGGGQEHGFRPGSPDVSALVGFGAAAAAIDERIGSMPQVANWKAQFRALLLRHGGVENGSEFRTPSALNVSLFAWRREDFVAALDLEGVCISAGAACSSGLVAESPIVAALYPEEPSRAQHAIRFSFGPERLDDQKVRSALTKIETVLKRA